MRVQLVLGGVVATVLACGACGGSGGGYGATPSPSPTPAVPASVTVSIVGDKGAQSFTPNPAAPGAALTVAWQNTDGTTHRIVANDNSFDTGNIGASGTSAAVTVPAGGVNYHCSIHPGMVGSVNGTSGTAPPCTGPYCAPQ